MTLVGDFTAANGLGKGYDEAEEVLAGIGIVKMVDVIGGLDSLRWGLEVKGRCHDRDLLGLWDRCEDDGLLGVIVWGEIDCRSSYGSIVGWRRDFGPRRWWCSEGSGGTALATGRDGDVGGGDWWW